MGVEETADVLGVAPNTVIAFLAVNKSNGPPLASAVIQTDRSNSSGVFSPDGKWMAYWSDETGTAAMYVVDYPHRCLKYRVRVRGGIPVVAEGWQRSRFFVDSKLNVVASKVTQKGSELAFGKLEV